MYLARMLGVHRRMISDAYFFVCLVAAPGKLPYLGPWLGSDLRGSVGQQAVRSANRLLKDYICSFSGCSTGARATQNSLTEPIRPGSRAGIGLGGPIRLQGQYVTEKALHHEGARHVCALSMHATLPARGARTIPCLWTLFDTEVWLGW